MESLVVESKTASIKLNNVFNEFLMVSNTQFVEHRVYEDDDDVTKASKAAAAATAAAPGTTPGAGEQEIMSKFTDAMKAALRAVDYFSIPTADGASMKEGANGENDDDEDDDEGEGRAGGQKSQQKAIVFVPARFDAYNARPLPHVIGTRAFLEDDSLGLNLPLDVGASLCCALFFSCARVSCVYVCLRDFHNSLRSRMLA